VKIDFVQVIKDSAKFTWKYKILWVFGFLLTFFSSGVGSADLSDLVSDQNYNFQNSRFISEGISFYESIANSGNLEAGGIALIIGLIVFLSVWLIVGIYFSGVSYISIVKSVDYDKKNHAELITFGNLFKNANKIFFSKYLYFYLIGIASYILLFLLFIPLTFAMVAFPPLFLLLCCAIPFLFILGYIFYLWFVGAQNIYLMHGYGIRESLSLSWQMVKTEPLTYFLYTLLNIIIVIVYGILLLIVSIPFGLLVFALLGLILNMSFIVGILVLLLYGFISLGITSAVFAPAYTFFVAYFAKTIDAIHSVVFLKQ
jgi:hypothetical protein